MTKDDIIRMAREAGFVVDGDSWIHAGSVLIDGRKSIDKQLKDFANLVAAHKAEIALAEAYRCGVEAGADELRRLHKVNQELLEALKDATEGLEIASAGGGVDFYAYAKTSRAAINKVEGEVK